MPSIINSDDGVVSGSSGLKSTGGNDGILVFQKNGTETARINTDNQLVVAAGTVSLPVIAPTGDLNTGVFFPAADTIAFTEGGTEALRINSSAQVEFTDGTAALPSITNSGDTNTGVYFSSGDTVDIATGGTQRAQFDASGNFKFNSGYGSVATAYGCRAWVNFNGTTNVGGFCTIRASGNVTSVADNGTGDFTINFTNPMPDGNYVTMVNGLGLTGTAMQPGGPRGSATNLTTSVRIGFGTVANAGATNTATDPETGNVAIFR
jgi:hypothetical protein